MKKILVVEDDQKWQEKYRQALDDRVLIIHAHSIKEAEERFSANGGLSLVVMDGCVPGDIFNTEPLVKKIRATFSGPIIAASSSPDCRRWLMEAGCDYESEKRFVPGQIIRILEIPIK